MQASKRAFFKRSGAACAAAAVLLGGTFTATAAQAAPQNDPTSVASSTATTTATSTATSSALPDGLTEAVKRDLGMTLEEFNAQGALADKAATVQTEVAKVDPNAVVSVSGGTIKVQTSAAAAAKSAAGTTKVSIVPAKVTQAPSTKVEAASVDALLTDYVGTFGAKNLQSIMINGNGEFVIRTGDAASASPTSSPKSFSTQGATTQAAKSTSDFAAKYGNVLIQQANGPAKAAANDSDVVGGQGYLITDSGDLFACSIGWNGFNKAGAAAVITAGHCSADSGADPATTLSDPTKEPAVGGQGGAAGPALGNFGFSQFGGTGNAPVTVPSNWDGDYNNLNNIGTDVSVIDDINPSLNALPQVTDWKNPGNVSSSGPKVTNVSTAIVGASVCKSGRTTGWTCGTVSEANGVFLVGGIQDPDSEADLRAVRGFTSTTAVLDHGDSGGAVISGTSAVAMSSAIGTGAYYYANLTTALAATDGYTVKIFLNTPTLVTPANNGNVSREGTITGTVADAPAGTTVKVTIDGVTTVATVGTDGKWSVKAPNKFGTFKVTAQAKNGFSTSASADFTVNIVKEALAAPAITSPSNGSTVSNSVSVIGGTGKAGATIELSGDVTGTVVVGADGKWSFPVSPALALGDHSVTAKQTMTDWDNSPVVTSTFKVVLAAPAITSVANGHQFPANEGPSSISGTNVPGAKVTVTFGDQKYEAVVDGGKWTVSFDAKLVSGDYTASATQTVDGKTSGATTVKFTVLATVVPPTTAPPTTAPPTTAPTTSVPSTTAPATTAPTTSVPSTQAPTPTESNPVATPAPTKAPEKKDDLANTGASSSTLALGAVGGVLLLSGAAFLLFRRRSSHS